MTRTALRAQAKSRRNSFHSRLYDPLLSNKVTRGQKRSLSMPDVYSISKPSTNDPIFHSDPDSCQISSQISSQETISSGLKTISTHTSGSSIGSSRNEGIISARSYRDISPKGFKQKFSSNMKNAVLLGSTKRLDFLWKLTYWMKKITFLTKLVDTVLPKNL